MVWSFLTDAKGLKRNHHSDSSHYITEDGYLLLIHVSQKCIDNVFYKELESPLSIYMECYRKHVIISWREVAKSLVGVLIRCYLVTNLMKVVTEACSESGHQYWCPFYVFLSYGVGKQTKMLQINSQLRKPECGTLVPIDYIESNSMTLF